MNFDFNFIHDNKRISNEKVFFIKRAKIDKNKNRQKMIFILSLNFYDDIRRKIESKSKQKLFTSKLIIKKLHNFVIYNSKRCR